MPDSSPADTLQADCPFIQRRFRFIRWPTGNWHESRIRAGVLIAIPVLQERISPVLDTATRLLLITRQRGKERARREVILRPLTPEELARSLAELHVDVLLCAALSQGLLRELERLGLRVQSHLCGATEAVLRAFCCDRLNRPEFRMPGCAKLHSPGSCCRRRNAAQPGKSSGKEKSSSNPPSVSLQNHSVTV